MHAKRHGLEAFEAYGDEEWICDFIDDKRASEGVTIAEAADYLSRRRPKPGTHNPGYGLSKEYIIHRYTHRKRYHKSRWASRSSFWARAPPHLMR
jgi:hypothetical protein